VITNREELAMTIRALRNEAFTLTDRLIFISLVFFFQEPGVERDGRGCVGVPLHWIAEQVGATIEDVERCISTMVSLNLLQFGAKP